jgi:hypothetical protein
MPEYLASEAKSSISNPQPLNIARGHSTLLAPSALLCLLEFLHPYSVEFSTIMISSRFNLENFDNNDPRILTVLLIGTEENVKAHILRQFLSKNGFINTSLLILFEFHCDRYMFKIWFIDKVSSGNVRERIRSSALNAVD